MPMYLEKKNYHKRLQLTTHELAYFAGLFDGEGSVAINFRKANPATREVNTQVSIQVALGMTHSPTIEWLCEKTGVAFRAYDRPVGWKKMYIWRPPLPVAYDLMEQSLPYLITKKRNAEIFIELMDCRSQSTRSNRNWNKQEMLVMENQHINGSGDKSANVYSILSEL